MIYDPWTLIQTRHGFAADEVISALQKEIRRGETENAALLAYEMLATSPELEAMLWRRLQVISVEDIGFGDLQAPVLVNALYEMHTRQSGQMERSLFAIHAVRYLASCQKDRSSDELCAWMRTAVEDHGVRPEIPDYALDKHTRRGLQMGRGRQYFYEESSKVVPELAGRDTQFRERLLKLLEAE